MKRTLLFFLWLTAFITALFFDTSIAAAVHDSGLGRHVEVSKWAWCAKLPGDAHYTIPIILLIWACRQIHWRQMVFALLAQAVGGVNGLLKWMIGRYRPYKVPGDPGLHPFKLHPFLHGLRGLTQHDLSFPSGHECTAGAMAAAMLIIWPRAGWVFIILAIEVGIERVIENAHYTSDVIAAVGFSALGVVLLKYALRQTLLNIQAEAKRAGFEVITS